MFTKTIFTLSLFALMTMPAVTAAVSSSTKNQVEGAVRGQDDRGSRRSNRRNLQDDEDKDKDKGEKGGKGDGKGKGKGGGDDVDGSVGTTAVSDAAEFVYLSIQDLAHLSTVPVDEGERSSSAPGVQLSGDMRCTSAGLCSGVGSYSLIGEGSSDPNSGDDPTLEVLIGGPVIAPSYNPDGSFAGEDTEPLFYFYCPISSYQVTESGIESVCECDESGGDCEIVAALLGNPVILEYSGTCVETFSARVFLECTD